MKVARGNTMNIETSQSQPKDKHISRNQTVFQSEGELANMVTAGDTTMHMGYLAAGQNKTVTP